MGISILETREEVDLRSLRGDAWVSVTPEDLTVTYPTHSQGQTLPALEGVAP